MTDAVASASTKKRSRPPEEVAAPVPGKRGGARPGAGRKSAAHEAATADASIIYAKSKAKKMAFDAQMAELEFKVKSGEYLPRADIKEASATAFAMIAQALRSIPDNIERRLGVSPEVAEEISALIDEAMSNLADELERMHSGR